MLKSMCGWQRLDLAVLDVACGAGACVNRRLEALAAIRAFDQVKLQAARGASICGYARLDHWRKTVLRINALRIVRFHGMLGQMLASNGLFHRLTIHPTTGPRQCPHRGSTSAERAIASAT